ncbi:MULTISPECIES: AidA/PixA family protein [Photorhabdus]|uniref:Inclusion body protein n=2 Tax=Photorhabdus asymbiotica TaxID=291112 RepID=B6VM51_PHOAA|nr:AidA/PixA family protein [Photorhabdus asymbiotica]RKS54494.1 inclusion body protein [Photorhabdus asymbiotica]CAQ82344.1 conserved hypothetical protein [Photorhabdus asymbiotica]CAR67231.1 hypothetical protein aida [Photorhabdus asymbiotica subsp. asymbiotica ATCC 43949]
MSEIVDVLVCVDVNSIIKEYSSLSNTPNSPTKIDNKFIRHITSNSNTYLPEKNATGELKIKINIGDTIKLRVMSLTQQFEYGIYPHKIVMLPEKKVTLNASDNYSYTLYLDKSEDSSDICGKYENQQTVDNYIEWKSQTRGQISFYCVLYIYNVKMKLNKYIFYDTKINVL